MSRWFDGPVSATKPPDREPRGCLDTIYGAGFVVCGLGVLAILPLARGRDEPWFLIALVALGGVALVLIGVVFLGVHGRFWNRAVGIAAGGVLLGMGIAMLWRPEEMTTTHVRGPATPGAAADLGFLIVAMAVVAAAWLPWLRWRTSRNRPLHAERFSMLAWAVLAGAHLWLSAPGVLSLPALTGGRLTLALIGSVGWSALPVLIVAGIWRTRLVPVLLSAIAVMLAVGGARHIHWAEEIVDPRLPWPYDSRGGVIGAGIGHLLGATAIAVGLLRRHRRPGSARRSPAVHPGDADSRP